MRQSLFMASRGLATADKPLLRGIHKRVGTCLRNYRRVWSPVTARRSGKGGDEPSRERSIRAGCQAPASGEALPVVLKASGAEAMQAVHLECPLPGEEFLFRKLVARASFLAADRAALYRGYHRSLTAARPPFYVGMRQLLHSGRSDAISRSVVNRRPELDLFDRTRPFG